MVTNLAIDPDLLDRAEVQELKDALFGADVVVTTGLDLQELLQGSSGPKAQS
jgi:hypothetical protein